MLKLKTSRKTDNPSVFKRLYQMVVTTEEVNNTLDDFYYFEKNNRNIGIVSQNIESKRFYRDNDTFYGNHFNPNDEFIKSENNRIISMSESDYHRYLLNHANKIVTEWKKVQK